MQIARVVGDITATQKHLTHEGRKILLVQPLDLDGTDRGNPVVALDSVQAGIGDRVLLVQDGFAAFTAVGHKQAPIDAAVIGVIDHVELLSDFAAPAPTPAPAGAAQPAEARPVAKKQNKKNRS
ncbi:MAG: EutN/CcmL family microcompartment protein [Candidatus Solibacter usitatus]|nr:EutN/CcmL family microcompartment protein [Candidatus Solibacter usitatus]